MATQVYKIEEILLIDGTVVEIVPLKIKYLREVMDVFNGIKYSKNNEYVISRLVECTRICMKQYYPKIGISKAAIEDNLDLPTIYKIINIAAGIKINKDNPEEVVEKTEEAGVGWDKLDLAKLEAEVFLLGIWKDYQDLEESLSMPELMITISNKRELDYEEKKFLAAIQGVDLDKESGSNRGQKEWEDMKARVFSKGKATDSKDVLALQGQNAKKVGFGIGMGLDYDDMRDPSVMKS